MAGNSFQKKLDQTANLLQDNESYCSKAWNAIFEKYQNLEDSRALSLEELEYTLSFDPVLSSETTLHDSTGQYSSESLSSRHEERDSPLNTPSKKLDYISPGSPCHTAASTQSLSLSTNSDNSLSISGKVFELNIDKLSPEIQSKLSPDLSSKLSPPTPDIKTDNKNLSKSIKTVKMGDKEDFLTHSSTQEIKLVQKQLFMRPSKQNISFRPITHTPPSRLTTWNSEEVPPEVEHVISTAYREFMNTDMIQVLRGILTFRNYRFRGERHNKILTPFIETSLTLPLKIKDENFTLKLTPLSLLKNPSNSLTVKRAALSQISCSPNQLTLRDRAQFVPAKRSEYTKNSSTKLTKISTSSPLTNGIGLMHPIKLLETSPFSSTPHSNRAITSQLIQEYTSTPKSSLSHTISSNTPHTPSMVHESSMNTRKIGLYNIKLLNTSADSAALQNVQNSEITPVQGGLLKPNHQTHQFSVRLLETTPTTNLIKRYVEPTRLPAISNSVDQELKLVHLDNSPFQNSTPVKRTLSRIIDDNLSKRVRLDTFKI